MSLAKGLAGRAAHSPGAVAVRAMGHKATKYVDANSSG